jgi:predicted nucleic acid-binding protein
MRAVFADAGYWVAIANSRDRLHARAAALAERLGEYRIVTSEMVLVEVLMLVAKMVVYVTIQARSAVVGVRARAGNLEY